MTKALFRKLSGIESTIEFTGSMILFSQGSYKMAVFLLILSVLEIALVRQQIQKYIDEGFPIKF